jgi:hypothetical protein
LSRPENLAALADLPGQWIDKVHQRRPPRIVVLDMDSSESPTYGTQECGGPAIRIPLRAAPMKRKITPNGLGIRGMAAKELVAVLHRGAPLPSFAHNPTTAVAEEAQKSDYRRKNPPGICCCGNPENHQREAKPMAYEGELLTVCPASICDFRSAYAVVVSGSKFNPYGHMLLNTGGKGGDYFQVSEVYGNPRVMDEEQFQRYLTENDKTIVTAMRVTILHPDKAQIKLEEILSKKWVWGGCFT